MVNPYGFSLIQLEFLSVHGILAFAWSSFLAGGMKKLSKLTDMCSWVRVRPRDSAGTGPHTCREKIYNRSYD